VQRLTLFFVSFLCLTLVACAGPGQSGGRYGSDEGVYGQSRFPSPGRAGGGGGMAGGARGQSAVAVAILLPFNSPDEDIQALAVDLFHAIELALFDLGVENIALLVEDTQGTDSGAAIAAQNAVRRGADIVIGPLFAHAIAAATPILQRANIPVLALSNDRRYASEGVWLLGHLPEQQIERIVIHATQKGLTRFAVLLPENAYGAWLNDIIEPIIVYYGGRLVVREQYPADAQDMFEPVQRLAYYQERKTAHQKEAERLTRIANALVPETTDESQRMKKLKIIAPETAAALEALARSETMGEIPYDAVLMPDGGLNLRNLAPLLPYFDVDPKYIQFLGSSLWDDDALTKEPPLHGAWFPATNPEGWQVFASHFEQKYGRRPLRAASLGYDALSLIGTLVQIDSRKPFSERAMTDVRGFSGIDGPLRLMPDGTNQRSFAVMEIRSNRFKSIAPPAASFALWQNQREEAHLNAEVLSRPPEIGWQGGARLLTPLSWGVGSAGQ
jgi:hypothetical protein